MLFMGRFGGPPPMKIMKGRGETAVTLRGLGGDPREFDPQENSILKSPICFPLTPLEASCPSW